MPRIKKQPIPEEPIDNPYLSKPSKITFYRRETADSFTIRTDFKIKHEPGQFAQIWLPGIGEAPISICSWSEEFTEFHIREVGNVTKYLARLKKGDTIHLRGPYGRPYPVSKFHGKSLVLVGGGCGVAPLKGVISYLEKHKDKFNSIHMYFGFRSPDDICFKEDMKKWAKRFDLHLTVDQNPKKKKITCDVCFITDVLAKTKINPDNKIVFICGPPIMMNIAINHLKSKGFKEEQIYISAERLMNCALGVCGHCMINGKYTCMDGPVFRYDEVSNLPDINK